MYAIVLAAVQTAIITVIGPLLVRIIMFLCLNIGMQYLLTQMTGISANVMNPFNIGPLINSLLAGVLPSYALWGMSFIPLGTALTLCLNAVFANWLFSLMRDLL
jgi:hypothetical protein